ncbi:MAG: hypothetical protein JNM12_11450 [Alphaproteobacteria bacterium]|nr:hypothetical protein [Alphaproteobacteria bacterium]
MAEQTPLSGEELRDAFEAAKTSNRKTKEINGTASILQQLSDTVRQLQEIGIDITVKVMPDGHSNAYDMMYVTSKPKSSSGSIQAYGYIHIGTAQRLFAIADQIGGEKVSRLYLSKFNVTVEGGRSSTDNGASKTTTAIPGEAFDFEKDAEALKKLQTKLVNIAAEYATVMEQDKSGVFNAPASAYTKPAGRLKV